VPPRFISYFYAEVAKVGFFPILGKNFLSLSFAQMNLRVYELETYWEVSDG
jgi:hypothetical protein